MKKMMIFAVMAVACLTANAQTARHSAGSFTIQPMLGLSTGSLRGEEKTSRGYVEYENDGIRAGLTVGAEAEYYTRTDWFTLSAGAMYTQQGWVFDGSDGYTVKMDYINVPVLANFYVLKGFALKVGLQPGFLVNAKNGSADVMDKCNSFNLSLPVGLSYEFKNGITLDLRGAVAVTNLSKNSDRISWYSDCGMLTIGYKFSLK